MERFRAIGLSFVALTAIVTAAPVTAAAGRACLDDPLWAIFARGAYGEVVDAVSADSDASACALSIAARATAARGFCAGFGKPENPAPHRRFLETGADFAVRAVTRNGGLIDTHLEQAHTNGFLLRDFGRRGLTETTLHALQQALAVDPDDPEALVGIGLFQLGVGVEKTKGLFTRALIWVGDTFFIEDATDEQRFRFNATPPTAAANMRRGLDGSPDSLILAHAVVSSWGLLRKRLERDGWDGDIDALAADLGIPDLADIVASQHDVIARAGDRDGLTHYQRCMVCAVDPSLRPNDCPPWVTPE